MRLTNGRLYGLFNNGGFGVYGPLNAISRQQMEKQFSTNFFWLTSAYYGVTAGDVTSWRRTYYSDEFGNGINFYYRGAYAASKYAVEAWSDALRMELASTGIKVSLIEPGPIKTRFTENVNQAQQDKPVKIRGLRVVSH
ncbi:SDR family NAD(P)-dependent oxidoreductase [Proteus mirabilis]